MSDIMNSNINKLFEGKLSVINVGSPSFCADYASQGISYTHLKWSPPADGNPELLEALDTVECYRDKIDAANQKVFDIITSGEGRLVAVATAIDVVPGMTKNTIYHAGPPISFKDMPGTTRGAVIGAILFEGLAITPEEALAVIERGEVNFSPCHEHCCVGPMTGVLTASMAVNVIYNETYDNYAYCSINEGLGKVLRMGANSPDVIEKLKWISTDFKKVIQQAITLTDGGIDIIKVIETGVLPIINTGIAHKDAGIGQVGAGLVNPPVECFEQALLAFADYLRNINLRI